MLNATGIEHHEQRTNYEAPKSTSIYMGGRPKSYYEVGAPVDDGSVEINLNNYTSRSSLEQPSIENKVQESIWRLRNKK